MSPLLRVISRERPLIFRHIKVYVKHVIEMATKTDAFTKINAYSVDPTLKYIFGKLKEINQIPATVKMIRLLVTLVRYVFGFRTARYLSTAKLEMLITEAVHEMKKLMWVTIISGLEIFFPRLSLI